MNNNTISGHDAPCRMLLARLKSIEEKCEKILAALSTIEKLLPADMDRLLLSIKRCADDLLEQSVKHRQYIEREMGTTPRMHVEKGGRCHEL